MPPSNRETRVQMSVLDRLLDDEPKNREEVQPTRSQTIARLKDALRRDLEWLLNTRAFPEQIDEELKETEASVFTYGLPDFSSLAAGSKQTKTKLERALQRALEVFEPRLLNVEVKAVEGDDKGEKRTIRFLISGFLNMSPAPLQISFDTRLQLARGEYRVLGD